MPTVIDPKAYIIGAAEVYYRAIGSVAAWSSVGATVGDVIFRVSQTTFNPSENFNGVLEQIREMDYVSKAMAEADFEMPEMAGPKLSLAILGAQSAVLATTAAGGGGSSVTTAATVIGATSVAVAIGTNFAAGDYIKIDTATLGEYRVITVVTALVLSFRDPLLQAHASGVAVVETIGDGKTEITGATVRRQPLTAYNDWALVAQSPADYYELYLYNAISKTDTAEIAFGNATMAAIKVKLGSRLNGANLALPSWKLRVPA